MAAKGQEKGGKAVKSAAVLIGAAFHASEDIEMDLNDALGRARDPNTAGLLQQAIRKLLEAEEILCGARDLEDAARG